ncbi:TPA: EpsG family protein [Photobacterium damselae]
MLFFFLYIVLLLGCIYSLENKKVDIIVFIAISAVFFIFILNRIGLGVDEYTYRSAYSYYLTQPNYFKFEYGFHFLYYILKEVGISTESFNNIISLLFFLLTLLTVLITVSKGYRSIVLISLIFSGFYIDCIFNAYRQGFAVLFIILSIHFYKKKRLIKFIVSSFLAIGFHWSSILILFFVFISNIIPDKILKKILLFLIFMHIFVIFFKVNIFEIFDYKVLINLNLKNLSDAISSYIMKGGDSFYDYNLSWRLITIFPILFSLIFTYINYKYNLINCKIFVVIMMYSFVFIGMAYGFRNYYWALPIFSFLIPDLISNTKKWKVYSLLLYLPIWCFIGFFYSSILPMVYL